MRETLPASTLMLRASVGAKVASAFETFDSQAGTSFVNLSAGLETMKRLALLSFPARAVLSMTTPPKECPSGTTSPVVWVSTCLINAARSRRLVGAVGRRCGCIYQARRDPDDRRSRPARALLRWRGHAQHGARGKAEQRQTLHRLQSRAEVDEGSAGLAVERLEGAGDFRPEAHPQQQRRRRQRLTNPRGRRGLPNRSPRPQQDH